MGVIPIRNVYYLLVYAWDALDEGDVVDVNALDRHTQTVELLAGVLANATAQVLRRGLDRGYIEETQVLAGIRGKLDVGGSVKQALFPLGRAQCHVDELSYDVPHNQIVRSTLSAMSRTPGITSDLRRRLADLYRRFEGVSEVAVTPAVFRGVQLHRNNRHYALLMNVCRLFHDNVLVDERSGVPLFRDFIRDEHRMRRLFERFVRTFYRRHARGYRVRSVWLPWQEVEGTAESRAFLPSMKTDIVLESADRAIVLDTKFKHTTLAASHGHAHIHTANLYQLYAYLKNMALMPDFRDDIEGFLLYPEVDGPVHVDLNIQGHRVQVHTINLDRSWSRIHNDLLGLLAA